MKYCLLINSFTNNAVAKIPVVIADKFNIRICTGENMQKEKTQEYDY
jgi:hypothetical protein